MDNGIYVTLSRQIGLMNDMAVTANNIANTNTTGYSAERLMFNTLLVKGGNNSHDRLAFPNDISTYRDTESGSLTSTGNPLDVAIQGDAFFAVETPLGTRYTRAGNLTLDSDGMLITPGGFRVLDAANQPIQFEQDAKEITIGEAGNISVDGAELATLGVYRFENPQLLQRTGNSLYSTPEAPLPAEDARVAQGVLESSNVQGVIEMTHMIDVSRSVSSTTKMIETLFDLQRKTFTALSQQS